MSQQIIRISYSNEAELKEKLGAIWISLEEWTPYQIVRERFGYDKASANVFSMRLHRFEGRGGVFPKRMHKAGRKIKELKVTPALAEHLTRKAC